MKEAEKVWYPTAQKNFKFFPKMKEFEMLIFKLTKIPYQKLKYMHCF